MLKKSNKVGSTATVSGTVYWSYPILPFWIVAHAHFYDNLSQNSCIYFKKQAARVSKTGHEHSVNISRILSSFGIGVTVKIQCRRRYNSLCNYLNAYLLIYLVSGMAGEAWVPGVWGN